MAFLCCVKHPTHPIVLFHLLSHDLCYMRFDHGLVLCAQNSRRLVLVSSNNIPSCEHVSIQFGPFTCCAIICDLHQMNMGRVCFFTKSVFCNSFLEKKENIFEDYFNFVLLVHILLFPYSFIIPFISSFFLFYSLLTFFSPSPPPFYSTFPLPSPSFLLLYFLPSSSTFPLPPPSLPSSTLSSSSFPTLSLAFSILPLL